MNSKALGMAAALLLGAAGCCITPAMAQTDAPKAEEKSGKVDLAKAEKRDLIIFRSGNKVEGVVLEETETSVKMLVIIGSLRSEATYAKSEILDIKRNEFKPSDAKKDDASGDKKDEARADRMAADSKADSKTGSDTGQVLDEKGKPIPPGTLKVYEITWRGELGREVSKTPVKAMMDDLVRIQPDVFIVRFDHDRVTEDGQEIDFMQEGSDSGTYQLLETARELDSLIGDRFRDDPAFKTKPRQAAWIRTALGGGAFLPFVFPEIYFASDGLHGGIGGLDFLFKGVGDEVAQRKQQSLRLARAAGLAEKGGYDKRIMKAMTWSSYILSYRLEGGKVVWLEDQMPTSADWFLLKDDGIVNEAHRDSLSDRVRMKGNDLLTLDANTAFDIGLSKGTADNVTDLLAKMGITRDYAIVKSKGPEIFKDWAKDVHKAESDISRLIRAFREVKVKPPGQYEQRTAARGQQKNILLQIKSLIDKYRESINARRLRIPGADEFLNQLDVSINQIDNAQRLDQRP